MKLTKQRLREIIKEELAEVNRFRPDTTGLAASMPHPFDPPRRRPRDEKPFQEKDRVERAGRGEGTVHSVWKHSNGKWVVDVNWDDTQFPKKETTAAGILSLVRQ